MEKLYRYGCFHAFWQTILGYILAIASASVFFLIPVVFIIGVIRTGRINMSTTDLLGFAFVWLLSGPSAILMAVIANLFSPILISEKHLIVCFGFRKFPVSWENVYGLKNLMTLGNRGVLICVSKSSLPWFFVLCGTMFGQIGGRCIPVSSAIENYQDLVREIKQKSPHLGID